MYIVGAIALLVGGLVLGFHFLIRGSQWKLIEFFGIMVLASFPMGGMMKFMSKDAPPLSVEDILIMIPYASIYTVPVFFGAWWAHRSAKIMNVESSAAKLALVVAGTCGLVGLIFAIPALIMIGQFTIFGETKDFAVMCGMTVSAAVLIAPCAVIESKSRKATAERIKERRERAVAKGLKTKAAIKGEESEK